MVIMQILMQKNLSDLLIYTVSSLILSFFIIEIKNAQFYSEKHW